MIWQVILAFQIAMLLTGAFYLWRARHIITPRGSWVSFVLRDLLWVPCLLIEYLVIRQELTLSALEVAMLIQTVIIVALLYAIVQRYRLQWQERDYHRKVQQKLADDEKQIADLEKLRNWHD